MIDSKQTKALVRKVEKFNADLAAYYKESGEEELPLIESTVVGFTPASPYTCQVLKTRVKVTDTDGQTYTVTDEWGLDEVLEALKYDRRRLAKAWRIWKSENPDAELEKDEEEEE